MMAPRSSGESNKVKSLLALVLAQVTTGVKYTPAPLPAARWPFRRLLQGHSRGREGACCPQQLNPAPAQAPLLGQAPQPLWVYLKPPHTLRRGEQRPASGPTPNPFCQNDRRQEAKKGKGLPVSTELLQEGPTHTRGSPTSASASLKQPHATASRQGQRPPEGEASMNAALGQKASYCKGGGLP